MVHDTATRADLAIDVRYTKGDRSETRHYVVRDVTVQQDGKSPDQGAIRRLLARHGDHRTMTMGGWNVDEVSGYYKAEHRNTGRRV